MSEHNKALLTAGRFTHAQVNHIVKIAFARFDRYVADLPSEPTLGSRQNVTLIVNGAKAPALPPT